MTPSLSRAVWLLALGLLLIYAGTFYAFPALLPALEAETGWGKPALALGPTLGALTTAAMTPVTGRLVDRGLGKTMLLAGPLLAVGGMTGLAVAPNPWVWWLSWAVIGVAQAGCVYETVFSLLTRRMGAEARGAITRVTLIAGLSGTLTFPLGHVLGTMLGGQHAYFGFAALGLLGTLPLYALAGRHLGPEPAQPPARPGDAATLAAALRRPVFWGIAAIFAASWLDHGLLLTYILPLFHDRGVAPEIATLAAATIGPAQLAGRTVLMVGGARIRNRTATKAALVLVVLAALVLLSARVAPLLVFLVVAVQGAGMGLMSIMRPMLLVEVLGRQGFGAISGAAAVAPLLAGALAPSLGALLLSAWGPAAIYWALLALSAFALGLALWLLPRPRLEG